MRVSVMVERRGELRHAVVVEVRSNLKLNNNVEGRDRPRRFIGRIRLQRTHPAAPTELGAMDSGWIGGWKSQRPSKSPPPHRHSMTKARAKFEALSQAPPQSSRKAAISTRRRPSSSSQASSAAPTHHDLVTIFEEAAAPAPARPPPTTQLSQRSYRANEPTQEEKATEHAARLASWLQCRGAGATASEAKKAGFSASDLKGAGFTLNALWDGGFSSASLQQAGFSPRAVKAAKVAARRHATHEHMVAASKKAERERIRKLYEGAYSKRRQRGGKKGGEKGGGAAAALKSSWMTSSWTTAAGGSSSSEEDTAVVAGAPSADDDEDDDDSEEEEEESDDDVEDSQGDVTTSLHKLRLHEQHELSRIMLPPPPLPPQKSKEDIAREKEALRQQRLANAVEFRKANRNARDCRREGYTAAELRHGGYALGELWDAGYSVPSLLEAVDEKKVKEYRIHARRAAFAASHHPAPARSKAARAHQRGDKDDGGDDDNEAADEAREPADRGARDDVRRRWRRCADGQPADGTHVARQRDDDDAGEE